ncbi:MAG: hypothetical protein BM563_05055 [Bacteroidetes bacterium MedPE-SWsnd-G1]|uniref:Uncharacterized protein n=1 Tax=Urechidicola vernalis TaxID=3075600 RepID=A0ABU2Y6Z4_9FLAO|nr:hypothetical protein [Urechidicola sp. P050]MDT0553966.1 hypothetical protein [Urechidicola sp. P050]OIQ39181.1 MAG: hypothetical protein BM563_05055 [Bacteroidetes bacterium MedPE-SWsnd-G1]
MGRPPTRPAKLRDGFYIEVRNKGAKTGIKIRRENRTEMMEAVSEYRRVKEIIILGESKNDKWLEKPKQAV